MFIPFFLRHAEIYCAIFTHCTKMAEQGGRRDLDKLVKDGLSALVFGVGYKVGIIDHFIKIKQPCTAQELAQQTGMKQR